MPFTLDSKESRIIIRTFAEGLLSRFAHDLELTCRVTSGTAPDERSCHLAIPVGAIEVAGTRKGGKVDPNGLSPSERDDCLEKMRRDVFHGADTVHVEATLDRVKVISPKGKTVERPVSLTSQTRDDGSRRVAGQIELSLSALGSDPIKGPMNAFRVKDRVEVHFDMVFQPA